MQISLIIIMLSCNALIFTECFVNIFSLKRTHSIKLIIQKYNLKSHENNTNNNNQNDARNRFMEQLRKLNSKNITVQSESILGMDDNGFISRRVTNIPKSIFLEELGLRFSESDVNGDDSNNSEGFFNDDDENHNKNNKYGEFEDDEETMVAAGCGPVVAGCSVR